MLGMTLENYNFCMGIAGIVSALVVLVIWSRGL